MDLHEALYTTRAMRRVRPHPVPEQAVRRMLDASIRSPSGGNAQSWRFIAVTEPELKQRLGELYWETWEIIQTTVYPGRCERADAEGDKLDHPLVMVIVDVGGNGVCELADTEKVDRIGHVNRNIGDRGTNS